jgi:hypothetical protein
VHAGQNNAIAAHDPENDTSRYHSTCMAVQSQQLARPCGCLAAACGAAPARPSPRLCCIQWCPCETLAFSAALPRPQSRLVGSRLAVCAVQARWFALVAGTPLGERLCGSLRPHHVHLSEFPSNLRSGLGFLPAHLLMDASAEFRHVRWSPRQHVPYPGLAPECASTTFTGCMGRVARDDEHPVIRCHSVNL